MRACVTIFAAEGSTTIQVCPRTTHSKTYNRSLTRRRLPPCRGGSRNFHAPTDYSTRDTHNQRMEPATYPAMRDGDSTSSEESPEWSDHETVLSWPTTIDSRSLALDQVYDEVGEEETEDEAASLDQAVSRHHGKHRRPSSPGSVSSSGTIIVSIY